MLGQLFEFWRLVQHRTLSPDRLHVLREQKLRAVIRHAYEHVPYYRSLFTSAGLRPQDIRTLEDLTRIPVTTKEDLRAAGLGQITAQNIDLAQCLRLQTSGSTGKPFSVYLTRSEARTRRLIEFRAILSIGLRAGDRLTVLGPEQAHRSRIHQRLGLYRCEDISPFLPVEDQIRQLQASRPTVLWAYPNRLKAILRETGDRLSALARPRVLITSSAPLDGLTEACLRADLSADIFNFYGAIETGRIATECAAHRGLHVTADHLIVECLADDGTDGPGGLCVITTLNAFAMPFIRYRLGDLCKWIDLKCSCGSSFPLIGPPRGREWDMITLPSGKLLPSTPLTFLLTNCDWIDQFRMIQERTDHLVLQLVFGRTPPVDALPTLRARIEALLREPVRLDIEGVESLRDEGSKFRAFISRLSAGSPSMPSRSQAGKPS